MVSYEWLSMMSVLLKLNVDNLFGDHYYHCHFHVFPTVIFVHVLVKHDELNFEYSNDSKTTL